MLFAANQEQNETYTFKDVFLQPDKSDFILAMIKEVEAHEARSHWTLMKNSEFNHKHKNTYGVIKTVLSFWSFRRKRLPDGRLMKHKSRIFSHGVMQQWGVNYW